MFVQVKQLNKTMTKTQDTIFLTACVLNVLFMQYSRQGGDTNNSHLSR